MLYLEGELLSIRLSLLIILASTQSLAVLEDGLVYVAV